MSATIVQAAFQNHRRLKYPAIFAEATKENVEGEEVGEGATLEDFAEQSHGFPSAARQAAKSMGELVEDDNMGE